jgi:hypothetical protein
VTTEGFDRSLDFSHFNADRVRNSILDLSSRQTPDDATNGRHRPTAVALLGSHGRLCWSRTRHSGQTAGYFNRIGQRVSVSCSTRTSTHEYSERSECRSCIFACSNCAVATYTRIKLAGISGLLQRHVCASKNFSSRCLDYIYQRDSDGFTNGCCVKCTGVVLNDLNRAQLNVNIDRCGLNVFRAYSLTLQIT